MGNNTLINNFVTGDKILPEHIKQLITALNGVFLSRVNNVPTAGQNLGSSAIPWGTIHARSLIINGVVIDLSSLSNINFGAGFQGITYSFNKINNKLTISFTGQQSKIIDLSSLDSNQDSFREETSKTSDIIFDDITRHTTHTTGDFPGDLLAVFSRADGSIAFISDEGYISDKTYSSGGVTGIGKPLFYLGNQVSPSNRNINAACEFNGNFYIAIRIGNNPHRLRIVNEQNFSLAIGDIAGDANDNIKAVIPALDNRFLTVLEQTSTSSSFRIHVLGTDLQTGSNTSKPLIPAHNLDNVALNPFSMIWADRFSYFLTYNYEAPGQTLKGVYFRKFRVNALSNRLSLTFTRDDDFILKGITTNQFKDAHSSLRPNNIIDRITLVTSDEVFTYKSTDRLSVYNLEEWFKNRASNEGKFLSIGPQGDIIPVTLDSEQLREALKDDRDVLSRLTRLIGRYTSEASLKTIAQSALEINPNALSNDLSNLSNISAASKNDFINAISKVLTESQKTSFGIPINIQDLENVPDLGEAGQVMKVSANERGVEFGEVGGVTFFTGETRPDDFIPPLTPSRTASFFSSNVHLLATSNLTHFQDTLLPQGSEIETSDKRAAVIFQSFSGNRPRVYLHVSSQVNLFRNSNSASEARAYLPTALIFEIDDGTRVRAEISQVQTHFAYANRLFARDDSGRLDQAQYSFVGVGQLVNIETISASKTLTLVESEGGSFSISLLPLKIIKDKSIYFRFDNGNIRSAWYGGDRWIKFIDELEITSIKGRLDHAEAIFSEHPEDDTSEISSHTLHQIDQSIGPDSDKTFDGVDSDKLIHATAIGDNSIYYGDFLNLESFNVPNENLSDIFYNSRIAAMAINDTIIGRNSLILVTFNLTNVLRRVELHLWRIDKTNTNLASIRGWIGKRVIENPSHNHHGKEYADITTALAFPKGRTFQYVITLMIWQKEGDLTGNPIIFIGIVRVSQTTCRFSEDNTFIRFDHDRTGSNAVNTAAVTDLPGYKSLNENNFRGIVGASFDRDAHRKLWILCRVYDPGRNGHIHIARSFTFTLTNPGSTVSTCTIVKDLDSEGNPIDIKFPQYKEGIIGYSKESGRHWIATKKLITLRGPSVHALNEKVDNLEYKLSEIESHSYLNTAHSREYGLKGFYRPDDFNNAADDSSGISKSFASYVYAPAGGNSEAWIAFFDDGSLRRIRNRNGVITKAFIRSDVTGFVSNNLRIASGIYLSAPRGDFSFPARPFFILTNGAFYIYQTDGSTGFAGSGQIDLTNLGEIKDLAFYETPTRRIDWTPGSYRFTGWLRGLLLVLGTNNRIRTFIVFTSQSTDQGIFLIKDASRITQPNSQLTDYTHIIDNEGIQVILPNNTGTILGISYFGSRFYALVEQDGRTTVREYSITFPTGQILGATISFPINVTYTQLTGNLETFPHVDFDLPTDVAGLEMESGQVFAVTTRTRIFRYGLGEKIPSRHRLIYQGAVQTLKDSDSAKFGHLSTLPVQSSNNFYWNKIPFSSNAIATLLNSDRSSNLDITVGIESFAGTSTANQTKTYIVSLATTTTEVDVLVEYMNAIPDTQTARTNLPTTSGNRGSYLQLVIQQPDHSAAIGAFIYIGKYGFGDAILGLKIATSDARSSRVSFLSVDLLP